MSCTYRYPNKEIIPIRITTIPNTIDNIAYPGKAVKETKKYYFPKNTCTKFICILQLSGHFELSKPHFGLSGGGVVLPPDQ